MMTFTDYIKWTKNRTRGHFKRFSEVDARYFLLYIYYSLECGYVAHMPDVAGHTYVLDCSVFTFYAENRKITPLEIWSGKNLLANHDPLLAITASSNPERVDNGLAGCVLPKHVHNVAANIRR